MRRDRRPVVVSVCSTEAAGKKRFEMLANLVAPAADAWNLIDRAIAARCRHDAGRGPGRWEIETGDASRQTIRATWPMRTIRQFSVDRRWSTRTTVGGEVGKRRAGPESAGDRKRRRAGRVGRNESAGLCRVVAGSGRQRIDASLAPPIMPTCGATLPRSACFVGQLLLTPRMAKSENFVLCRLAPARMTPAVPRGRIPFVNEVDGLDFVADAKRGGSVLPSESRRGLPWLSCPAIPCRPLGPSDVAKGPAGVRLRAGQQIVAKRSSAAGRGQECRIVQLCVGG